jgi:hypothetical protein
MPTLNISTQDKTIILKNHIHNRESERLRDREKPENPSFFKSSSKKQLDVCTYSLRLSMFAVDSIETASKSEI